MKIFKFCSKYLKKYKLKLAIYVLIGLLATSIGIVTTYIIGLFLDTLVMAGGRQEVFNFALIFITLNIIKVLSGYLTTLLYINMQINMGNELNCDTKRVFYSEKVKAIFSQVCMSNY